MPVSAATAESVYRGIAINCEYHDIEEKVLTHPNKSL